MRWQGLPILIGKIERYWNISLLAWTLTYWIKQNAYLDKIIETKPSTFNEFKRAVNSLLEHASTAELSKNKHLAYKYFKIKSARWQGNGSLIFNKVMT